MKKEWAAISQQGCGTFLTEGIIGANHRSRGIPCQDASLAGVYHYRGYPYGLLIVADGHGATRYPRSDLGAHFAIQAGVEAAARWIMYAVDCLEQHPDDWFTELRNEFGQRFARKLRQVWQRQVEEHLQDHPLTNNKDPESVYGTTVALALVFQDYLFVGAIGDSKIFVIWNQQTDALAQNNSEEGLDVLAGSGGEHLGLTTHSLASDHAVSKWHHRVLPLVDIGLVCVTTDGLSDSLADTRRTLAGIYQDSHSKGLDWLSRNLPGFLARLTEEGVGDDIATAFYLPPAKEKELSAVKITTAHAGAKHE